MVIRFRALAFTMVLLAGIERVTAADTPSAYETEVATNRAERLQRLTKPDGWLSLVGLHFLQPGENSVGSAAGNSIVLAKGLAHLGSLTLQPDGDVYISLNPAADARVDGREVLRAKLEASELRTPTQVTCETLTLFVIERGGRMALRVKDSEAPRRKEFLGLDYFPIDPAWRIEAKWVEFEHPREVVIANILGQESPAMIPGKAVFTKDGHTFELLPLIEGVDEPLFFVISDATSGKETYPAARFVYADPPRGGKLVLDFNEAVNPPCAFTPFATCPLPPKENRMPIAVTAGEKKYAGSTE